MADPPPTLPLDDPEVRQAPLSVPSRAAALDTLVVAVRDGEGVTVLIGEDRAGTTALLDAAAAQLAPAIRLLRLGNPLSGPLTLDRVLIQLGGSVPDDPDAGEVDAVFHALRARAGKEGRVVVAVEDAETLAAQALLFLGMLPTLPAAGLPRLQLLLAGGPELPALIAQDRFRELRARVGTQVRLAPPAAGRQHGRPAAAPGPSASLPEGPVASAALPRRSPSDRTTGPPRRKRFALAAGGALLACAVLTVAIVASQSEWTPAGRAPAAAPGDDAPRQDEPPTEPRPASPAATGEPGTAPEPPPAPLPAASSSPALPRQDIDLPGSEAGVAQSQSPALLSRPLPSDAAQEARRREFEAFLNRQGGTPALMSPAQRAQLFQEYLAWRERSARTPPGGPPDQAASSAGR